MMKLIFSSTGLQFVLTVSVYFTLSTSSTKECELQLTETTKSRSVVLRSIDMKLCQTECFQDSSILAYCRRSSDEFRRTEATEVYSVRPENQRSVLSKHCGSKACSVTSQCVEGGCGKVCVEHFADSLSCELISACKSGDLLKIKPILLQGHAGINCKEWIGRTPVMWAARGGHTEVVELLVSKGANMSIPDRFGLTILHLACLGGYVEVVKYVLSRNMLDINDRVRCGRTAVMLAAENGHKDVLELLVDKDADVSLIDERGDNILHCACRGGDAGVVKYILSKKIVDVDRRGSKKMTPIMVAKEYKHREVVELLVSKRPDGSLLYYKHRNMLQSACQEGNMEVVKFILLQDTVNINSGWREKITPVMIAAEIGHKDVVELLVSKGADVSQLDKVGDNILHYACKGGHVEMVKYVLSQNMVSINSRGFQKMSPLMRAAEMGHKDVVELLVSKGADVSQLDKVGDNILHYACKGGHVEMVKYVLSQNMVSINSRGFQKMSPLMRAAEMGHKDVVELLVSKGADVSQLDKVGDNILHYACKGGHVEMVKYVLSQNMVSINSRGFQKMSPLMRAAEMGHKDVVELLVSKGADVSQFDEGGDNILHYACKGGHVEMVKYVLSQNMVSINSRGFQKMSPLMRAAEMGHKDVVELLVSKGADVSQLDEGGDNILHYACKGGHVEMVKYVLSQNMVSINSRGFQKMSPLMRAAEMGHKDVVELLVSKGADVSQLDEGGDNILHYACKGGHVEMVKYVLSQNMVSINSRGFQKMSPLMRAAEMGHKDVVELLVSKGADVSQLDKVGDNILHYACKGGHVEMVKYVLSQNMVGINSRGFQKMSPLMRAAEMGHKDVVELLVSKGADVSQLDEGGDNILHYACKGGHVEMVKYVLSQNMVSINSRGFQKMSPLMRAAEMGHKDVVELLVSKGADVSQLDEGGDNILHYACKGGHVEMVKYVLSQNMVSINSRGFQKMSPLMRAAEMGHKDVVELLVSKGADVSQLDEGGDNILHYACKGGHVEMVKYVLSQNMVSINSRGFQKMSPLMRAAEMGHKDVVELLVSKGADHYPLRRLRKIHDVTGAIKSKQIQKIAKGR